MIYVSYIYIYIYHDHHINIYEEIYLYIWDDDVAKTTNKGRERRRERIEEREVLLG